MDIIKLQLEVSYAEFRNVMALGAKNLICLCRYHNLFPTAVTEAYSYKINCNALVDQEIHFEKKATSVMLAQSTTQ